MERVTQQEDEEAKMREQIGATEIRNRRQPRGLTNSRSRRRKRRLNQMIGKNEGNNLLQFNSPLKLDQEKATASSTNELSSLHRRSTHGPTIMHINLILMISVCFTCGSLQLASSSQKEQSTTTTTTTTDANRLLDATSTKTLVDPLPATQSSSVSAEKVATSIPDSATSERPASTTSAFERLASGDELDQLFGQQQPNERGETGASDFYAGATKAPSPVDTESAVTLVPNEDELAAGELQQNSLQLAAEPPTTSASLDMGTTTSSKVVTGSSKVARGGESPPFRLSGVRNGHQEAAADRLDLDGDVSEHQLIRNRKSSGNGSNVTVISAQMQSGERQQQPKAELPAATSLLLAAGQQQPQKKVDRADDQASRTGSRDNTTAQHIAPTESTGSVNQPPTFSSLDYDDFDLDYQLKLNTSSGNPAADIPMPSFFSPAATDSLLQPNSSTDGVGHNSSKRDDHGKQQPPAEQVNGWSSLIKQAQDFVNTGNANNNGAGSGPNSTGFYYHQTAPILPSLLTVKSTQLSSQELDRVRPQFAQFYQDGYPDSAGGGGSGQPGADQSLLLAPGDLLATASNGGPPLAGNGSSSPLGGSVIMLNGSNVELREPQQQLMTATAQPLVRASGGSGHQQDQAVTTIVVDSSQPTEPSVGLPNYASSNSTATRGQWFNYPRGQQSPQSHILLHHHLLAKPAVYAQHINNQQQLPMGNNRSSLLQLQLNEISKALASSSDHQVVNRKQHAQFWPPPPSQQPPGSRGSDLDAYLSSQLMASGKDGNRLNKPPSISIPAGYYSASVQRQPPLSHFPRYGHQATGDNETTINKSTGSSGLKYSYPLNGAYFSGPALRQLPPADLSPRPIKQLWLPKPQPAPSSQMVASSSSTQEIYTPRPSSMHLNSRNQTTRGNQAAAGISDEDMSTYVAQLASFSTPLGTGSGGQQQLGSSNWMPSANLPSNESLAALSESLQQTGSSANFSNLNDLETLIRQLLLLEQANQSGNGSSGDHLSSSSSAAAAQLESGTNMRQQATNKPASGQSLSPEAQNYYSIEGHQRNQKKEREQQLRAALLMGQKQAAFIQALKASIARPFDQQLNLNNPIGSHLLFQQLTNGSSSSAAIGDETEDLQNSTSGTETVAIQSGGSSSTSGGDDFDDSQIMTAPAPPIASSKPSNLPEWLERQLLQESLIHESARLYPALGAHAARTSVIIGPARGQQLLSSHQQQQQLPVLSATGSSASYQRPNLAATSGQLLPQQPPLPVPLRSPASSLLQAAATHFVRPSLFHLNHHYLRHSPLFQQQQPIALASNQPLTGSRYNQQQISLHRLPFGGHSIVSSSEDQQAAAASSYSVAANSPSKLLADRFPFASAPAYLIKLPTLTGGTITAAGSLVPPPPRLLRNRPLVPLRLLGATFSPPRLRLVTTGVIQPAPSAMHALHQAPPYPLSASLALGASQQQPSVSTGGSMGSSSSPASMLQQSPSASYYQSATSGGQLDARPSQSTLQSPYATHYHQPPPEPLPPAGGDPMSSASSSGGPSEQSPSAQFANHNNQATPLRVEPQQQQQQQPQQQYFSSAQSQQTSGGSSQSPSSDGTGGGSGSGTSSGGSSPAAALTRLQQATASLVELTSLASLVDEMVGGSDIDPSPAVALVQALSNLSQQQQLQQQQSSLNTQASTTSGQSTGSGSSLQLTSSADISNVQPMTVAQLTLKSLLNPSLWRDKQLSVSGSTSSRQRDFSLALERLVANASKRPPGRIRVKYIRVPVAVYESPVNGLEASLLVPTKNQLITKSQLAELVASAQAANGRAAQSTGSLSLNVSPSSNSLNEQPNSSTGNSSTTSASAASGSGGGLTGNGSSATQTTMTTSTSTASGVGQSSASTQSQTAGGAAQAASGPSGSSTQASANDYLFDELGAENAPQLALALRDLAQQQQQEATGDSAASGEHKLEYLPLVANLRLPTGANHQNRKLPSLAQEQLSPLESAVYYSLIGSPNSIDTQLIDPSGGNRKPATSNKQQRGNRRGRKKKLSSSSELDSGDDVASSGDSESDLSGLQSSETAAATGGGAAEDDDRITSQDLPILESLISTLIHGPKSAATTTPAIPPYGFQYPAASQLHPALALSPLAPMAYASPLMAYDPTAGYGAWRGASRVPPFGEASSSYETYTPSGRHHHHHLGPFGRHRFSLGEVVGALGARKLISSLLNKRKRARTSKRAVQQASGAANLPGHQQHRQSTSTTTPSSIPVGKSLLRGHRFRPHTTLAPSRTTTTAAVETEASAGSGQQPAFSVWFPTSADHELTTQSSAHKSGQLKKLTTVSASIPSHHQKTTASDKQLQKKVGGISGKQDLSDMEFPQVTSSPSNHSLSACNEQIAQQQQAALAQVNRRNQQLIKPPPIEHQSTMNQLMEAAEVAQTAQRTQELLLHNLQQQKKLMTLEPKPPAVDVLVNPAAAAANEVVTVRSVVATGSHQLKPAYYAMDSIAGHQQQVKPGRSSKVGHLPPKSRPNPPVNSHQNSTTTSRANKKKGADVMAIPLYHVAADHYSKIHSSAPALYMSQVGGSSGRPQPQQQQSKD